MGTIHSRRLSMTTQTTSTIQLIPNLQEANSLARSLMDQHGLKDWSIKWTKTVRRLGRCIYATRTIEISQYQFDLRDTILHEIAHAKTPWDGHGRKWQAMCRAIGARPERCISRAMHGPGIGYKIICCGCNKVLGTRARQMRIIGRCKSVCCNAAVKQEKN